MKQKFLYFYNKFILHKKLLIINEFICKEEGNNIQKRNMYIKMKRI